MIEQTIVVRATYREVRRALTRVPAIATQGLGSPSRALLIRVGMAVLYRVRDAFVLKSHGECDETGLRWKPLSPETIAKRRHPGLGSKAKRAAKAPSAMLTQKQRDRWWTVYGRNLARYRGDKSHAAAAAWMVLKMEGAQTIIGVYGNINVDILRDSGLLLNTLSPGLDEGTEATAVPREPDQVFEVNRGEIILGTNRKWAGVHHKGNDHVPQRRLWPEVADWPQSWWNSINVQAVGGLVDIILYVLRNLR